MPAAQLQLIMAGLEELKQVHLATLACVVWDISMPSTEIAARCQLFAR